MSEPASRAGGGPGILAIAATYIYFLLYAQFGFLGRIREIEPDALAIQHAMGLMGAGGLFGSLGAAWLLGRFQPRRLLLAGFAGCGAAALATLSGVGLPLHYVAAFLIGAFTGLLTVTLAASLRLLLPGRALAAKAGAGTGLAYAVCNVPAIFSAPPVFQTLLAAGVCALGLVAVLLSPTSPAAPPPAARADAAGSAADADRALCFPALVAILFALVCLDSAVFAIIQLTPTLKVFTWGSGAQKMSLGIVHAAAAVVAGWWIDRGGVRRVLALTVGLFVVAFTWLQGGGVAAWAAGPLYATGISLYSVALVVLPSLDPERAGSLPVRWRAALLFALAGWIGSALGVALAQNVHAIPGTLVLTALLVVAGGLMFPLTAARRRWVRDYRALAPFGLCAAILYSGFFGLPERPAANEAAVIARGRRVYVQEGCINCHSQFIRPRTADVLAWGPARPLDFTERPPLPGNRRQGPDLTNVGLRRGAIWQRQHLIEPSSVSPGSRMPSYAALFREGDSRGSNLVEYLGSLGEGSGPERAAAVAGWSPHPTARSPSPARGAGTFQRLCATCHGPAARGDGPVAPVFHQAAMDLCKGDYLFIPRNLGAAEEAAALARLVKFGVAGLNMPGHETLSDADLIDLVAYLRQRNGRSSS